MAGKLIGGGELFLSQHPSYDHSFYGCWWLLEVGTGCVFTRTCVCVCVGARRHSMGGTGKRGRCHLMPKVTLVLPRPGGGLERGGDMEHHLLLSYSC